MTLELHTVSKTGGNKTIPHTPDFLVLTQDGVWLEEWKQESRLLELALTQPHRYQLDEQGHWRCPPGEVAAKPLGLGYRVRSSAELSSTAIRNLIFLEDYVVAPEVLPRLSEQILDQVRSAPGIRLAQLLQDGPQTMPDAVFTLLAHNHLYVDVTARPLIERDVVFLFPDRATAEAHALLAASHGRAEAAFEGDRASQHLALTANTRVLWDGRLWTLLNLGHTTVTLRPEEGPLLELPLTSFLDLIDVGSVTVPRTPLSFELAHLHPEA